MAITSNELTPDLVKKLREAGFDDWFTTPLTQKIIKTKILDKKKEFVVPKYNIAKTIETIIEENEPDEMTM